MGDEVWIGGGPPPRKIDPFQKIINMAINKDVKLDLLNSNLKGVQLELGEIINSETTNFKVVQKQLLLMKQLKIRKSSDKRFKKISKEVRKNVKILTDSDAVMGL